MAKECRVKNSEVYSAQCPLVHSSASPLEEVPTAAAEFSAATFVTPTSHKAVSLIIAHRECSNLKYLPISHFNSWCFKILHITFLLPLALPP